MEGDLFSWETSEYEYRPKSTDWYVALGIVTASFSIASYILQNLLFAILIVIGGFTLAIYGAKRPERLYCALTRHGVRINDKLHPYASLKSYWIDRHSEIPILIIQSKKSFVPNIILSLKGGIDSEEVASFLQGVLTEEELHIPLSQRILDRLGF